MTGHSQKEYCKKLLKRMLQDALKGSSEAKWTKIEPNDNADPFDRATTESEINFNLRIRERNIGLIRKIEKALEKIDDGTFGICEECGEDISSGRLKARPTATLCIECKRRQESEEAMTGM